MILFVVDDHEEMCMLSQLNNMDNVEIRYTQMGYHAFETQRWDSIIVLADIDLNGDWGFLKLFTNHLIKGEMI